MRVLVVSTNRERLPDPVVPLGATYLAAALREAGHDVEMIDLCFREDPAGDLARAIEAGGPQAVCFSLRNLGGIGAFAPEGQDYLPEYRRWAEIVRKASAAPLVIGGPAVSIDPGAMLDALEADFAVVGEAEEVAPRLIAAIARGDRTVHLPGVLVRGESGGGPFPLDLLRPADLDRLPLPARDLVDNARYSSLGGCGNVQTKRGCDRACIYCTYPLLEGRTIRARDPRRIAGEIVHMKEAYGIGHVFIVDSLFNHPIEHAERVCEEIVRRRPGVELSCYANPAFLTERLARLLAEAGFVAIEFGTDSGSDAVLERLRKGFRKDEIARASRLCRDHGLKFCHSLLFGAPGESWESVRETCEFIDSLEPTAVIAIAGLNVYPRTELERIVREGDGGCLPQSPVYVSPAVGEGLRESLARHGEQMANWIIPGTKLNMDTRILALFRQRGISGPLWRKLDAKRPRRRRSLGGAAPGSGG